MIWRKKMDKKTDFPDLERLPDHNQPKHFVYILLNQPRWFIEDLYEKFFLREKILLEEIELLKEKIELKEIESNYAKEFKKALEAEDCCFEINKHA